MIIPNAVDYRDCMRVLQCALADDERALLVSMVQAHKAIAGMYATEWQACRDLIAKY